MRKFARSMDEAFPFGPDYGCAIKCAHRPSRLEVALSIVINVGWVVGVFLAMLAYFDVLVP